jgi:DNA-binding NarL/FixJ family response regulator
MAPIRTVVVDDHEMVVDALAAVLRAEPDFDVVGAARDIERAVVLATTAAPDLLVTDLTLAGGEVTAELPRFRDAAPSCRVLVMTGNPSERSFLDAVRAGVGGYVSKSRPMADIVQTCRRVAAGEAVFPQAYLRLLLDQTVMNTARPRLTMREVDVLQRLAFGHSTTEVARELHLAVNTVRNHLAGAMSKLGTSNRLAAVAEAIRLGIVSPPTAAAKAC